jgi:hypothetical protein
MPVFLGPCQDDTHEKLISLQKGAGRRRPTNEPLRDANGGPTRYGVPPSKNEGSRARLSLPIIPTDRKLRLTLRSVERYARDPCSQ